MQTMILPDYLDGTKKSKKEVLQRLKEVCNVHDCIELVGIEQIGLTKDVPYNIQFLLRHDNALLTFLRAYSGYMKSDQKNYIVSKNLSAAFKKTKLDVDPKYLPETFQGYIEIPDLVDVDGCDIKGFFIDMNHEFGKHVFSCGYLVYDHSIHDYAPAHINIEIKPNRPVSESLLSYPYTVQNYDEDSGSLITKEFESEYLPYMGVLFNTLVYIHNSEDVTYRLNQFSKKKSKANGQKNRYTSKHWHEVGANLVLPREFTVDSTIVSGHFRWQPYGPQRSLIKHIYIQPHTRTYK